MPAAFFARVCACAGACRTTRPAYVNGRGKPNSPTLLPPFYVSETAVVKGDWTRADITWESFFASAVQPAAQHARMIDTDELVEQR